MMEEFEKQSLVDHLADLRSALVISLIAVAAGFVLCYSFIKDIGELFFRPLFTVLPNDSTLIFTSYQEAFFFI
jgi:Sec-independent protein secretion pathway component TatC